MPRDIIMELHHLLILVVFLNFQGGFINCTMEQSLLDNLFKDYNAYLKPPPDPYDSFTVVELGLKLLRILSVDTKNQKCEGIVQVLMSWSDSRLTWNPRDPKWYNISMLNVPATKVWNPRLVLGRHSARENDPLDEAISESNVLIYSNGQVYWSPQINFKNWVTIDVTYYPFDQQTMVLKFMSKTYHGDEVELRHYLEKTSADAREYTKSDSWTLIEAPSYINYFPPTYSEQNELKTRPPINVIFYLTLRRKMNDTVLIFLTMTCMALSIISFLFPLRYISLTVFATGVSLTAQIGCLIYVGTIVLPPTSYVIPLISKLIGFELFLSVCCHVVSLWFFKLRLVTGPVSGWIKDWIMNGLLKNLHLIGNYKTLPPRPPSIEYSEAAASASIVNEWGILTSGLTTLYFLLCFIIFVIGSLKIIFQAPHIFEELNEDEIISSLK